ncbi:zinc ribbon domain-containing protein [Sulfurimonas sp. HSL-1716]|uniref:zinc ribbon domain-containing protein n=1 Tax=Hydrocurvibacter sulfurireducens TaxID=3131937 RepID=UPI0031F7412C
MALLDCPECGHKVSSAAASCPSCGSPIAQDIIGEQRTTTIQETSKRLKLQIILSSALFWIGLIAVFTSPLEAASSAVPTLILFIGAVWYIVVRFMIWWNHK